MNPHLSVIVPVRNEAEFILPFYYDLIKHVPADFELVWVNDASTDSTLSEIEHLSYKDERIKCITLRKQFGKEAAVFAGLDYASGDYFIVMSGDLQHPSRLIPVINELLESGADIVNTKYSNSAKVFSVQKIVLDSYYRFLNRLNRSEPFASITDFRGFRRQVIDDIRFMKEKQFFSGYFFNWTDYKMEELHYENNRCGKNKRRYTIQHLLKSTIETFRNNTPGILKTMVLSGGALCIASIAFAVLLLIKYFSSNQFDILPFLLTALLFAGGLQMLIFSNYRRKLKQDLHKISKNHQYLIKSILEPEDSYLSNYSFPRKETIQF
jgi:glycosyltransferase involved in cell wall biosynthesis